MAIPSFEHAGGFSAAELCVRLADRVRVERRKLSLSQREFAERCDIPLRTYKRFELGQCDSLNVFVKIIGTFDRLVALELLFPPKPIEHEPRTATALLDRLVRRIDADERGQSS